MAALQQAARNYAKSQLTWFRNPCPDRARVQADIRRTKHRLRVGSCHPRNRKSQSGSHRSRASHENGGPLSGAAASFSVSRNLAPVPRRRLRFSLRPRLRSRRLRKGRRP
ncbi:hypothetical protein [Brevundimonas sp. TWP2-3-2]|uniref:hypothetical protein n=1 Tax=unclassified Brevundimonas TaxID=2622653 RepID=UPI003CF1C995